MNLFTAYKDNDFWQKLIRDTFYISTKLVFLLKFGLISVDLH